MFRYRFLLKPDRQVDFEVDETRPLPDVDPSGPVPGWLLLERFKCENCPLAVGSRETCPAAVSIRAAVETFGSFVSFETIRVEVRVEQFQFIGEVPSQNAVRSLVGLLLSLSACPILSRLRPMARYHLPFGDREHTEFRFLGMYLIAQRLRQLRGLEPDWELTGLLDLFRQLHAVNRRLAERLRDASTQDAAINSLIILDSLAYSAQAEVESRLSSLEPLFALYLQEPDKG
jgi:hypothetical protein